ncbi:ATPase [Flammeovirgaceae bacterium 311]|nr:ATPase [Flammeovirgaceae bacterium 311]
MVPLDKTLHQLAWKTNSIFFVFDPSENNFHYLSDNASVSFEIDVALIMKDPAVLLDRIFADDRVRVLEEFSHIGTKDCIEADFRLLFTPNQPVKWLHIKACMLQGEPALQGCIVGFAEDITSRKEIEMYLTNTHAQKDVALQILGHDIRSPIGTISAASSLLERSVCHEDLKNIEPLFRIISDTCQNALNLINDVLQSVYWDAQNTVKKKRRIDLVDMVENQLHAYRLLHQDQKDFKLFSSTRHVYIRSDQVRLQLILENLLSNAYKFTKRNGTIAVDLQEKEGKVQIAVKDDGIGIPDRLKPMIFQKFTNARREGMQGEKPTGLGLHIVKTMVEQLNGHIWFESGEERGTTFFVELPKKGI